MRLRVETADDVWTLRSIIAPGDELEGSTERKVKVGKTDEKGSVSKRRIRLAIKVEKTEYAPDGSSLRVLGTIIDGPEDIPRGEHHSFGLEPGEEVTLRKASWPSYLIAKLEESTKNEPAILVVLFDREEAKLYTVTKRGIEEVARLKGDVPKKAVDEKKSAAFFKEIVTEISARDERIKFTSIIAGAPAFWKEYVDKELPPALKKKTILTSISAVEKTAIRELLNRPEVERVIKENSTLREMSLVEQAVAALSKGLLAYGPLDISEAIASANVAFLLVTEAAIGRSRTESPEASAKLEALLRQCESVRGEVHVLSASEAASKIEHFGGVVAVKRW